MQNNFVQTTDWVKIAHKLRQYNRDLLKTVVQLEHALADSQARLQSHIQQVLRGDRTPDATPNQESSPPLVQAESNQEQVTCLLEEIEISYQAVQHQQAIVETLSQQLEASQERVAQLERECALLKEDHGEQICQIEVANKQVQELQSRLKRQQKQTLQFKTALKQCAETSADSVKTTTKSNSIQSWSSQTEIPAMVTIAEKTLVETNVNRVEDVAKELETASQNRELDRAFCRVQSLPIVSRLANSHSTESQRRDRHSYPHFTVKSTVGKLEKLAHTSCDQPETTVTKEINRPKRRSPEIIVTRSIAQTDSSLPSYLLHSGSSKSVKKVELPSFLQHRSS